MMRGTAMRRAAGVALGLAVLATALRAQQPDTVGAARPADLVVFVREGCPHCAKAKEWLAQLRQERPGLVVVLREVTRDPSALRDLQWLSMVHGVRAPGVPTFLIGSELLVGFDEPFTTGRQIEALLDRQAAAAVAAESAARAEAGAPAAGKAPPAEGAPEPRAAVGRETAAVAAPAAGAAPARAEPAAVQAPQGGGRAGAAPAAGSVPKAGAAPKAGADMDAAVRLPLIGTVDLKQVGLPAFTVAIGLLDGFNPCAMWVLLFLLSVLVGLKSRSRMLIIGGVFLLVSGAVYYAFMAAWLNVFLLLGLSRVIQVTLGAIALGMGALNLKDFFYFGHGPSLRIPERAKPGIYARVRQVLSARTLGPALVAVTVLAALVNTVELLCTAGLPALYTQVLTMRGLNAWEYYGYLGLYILFYMADDMMMLGIAVITLSNRRLQQADARWLKLVAGLLIGGLGAVLIFRPQWLAG